mgnify:CR=1 FL=1
MTAGFVFQVNKYTFTLKTGFIFNHITQANQVLNISGFNAIRTNVQSQLVSNSFYQLFQVGAEFPVSSHVSLMLSPSYSHALKSISPNIFSILGVGAIFLHHDKEALGKVTSNFFGIPTDGFGSSNNISGTPSFDDAKFIVKDYCQKGMDLDMKYIF